jgi:RHS repeat-associated protein
MAFKDRVSVAIRLPLHVSTNTPAFACPAGYIQTEHEGLDELGIIHMNGRIYDPYIGRFMSADPYIQAPYELQSHNRYSYVMNNPLLYTDPSGYHWLQKLNFWSDKVGASPSLLFGQAAYNRGFN